MLSKAHRLATADFNTVMEKGRVTHSSLFVMRHLLSQNETRFSAVVPQKVAKKAVMRSSMRRKMYEAIRKLGAEDFKGIHALVFAKVQAVDAEKDALLEDMKSLFVKAGILR